MDLNLILPMVQKIHGCTFANIDALTEPKPGVSCRTTGERVIIFRTNGASGFEGMVKRKLIAAGKNPDLFKVGPLPWGTRVGDLPIIENHGKHYLQTILLAEGKSEHFLPITGDIVDPKDFGIRPRFPGNQGLPPSDAVIMHTYKLDSIHRLVMFGETLEEFSTADKPTRAILGLNFPAS